MPVLEAAAINGRHRERFRLAMAALGDGQTLGLEAALQLNELTRVEWIEYYKAAEDVNPDRRTRVAGASALIAAELARRVGQTVRAREIAEAAGVSEAAFYAYAGNGHGHLSKLDRGSYLVRDVVAERAAAGRPTIANQKLHKSAGTSVINRDAGRLVGHGGSA